MLVKMMSRANEVSTGQFPVYDKAPLYLRETLLFPYTQGMLFQHAVVEKLDKAAFTEVFRQAADKHATDFAPGQVLRVSESGATDAADLREPSRLPHVYGRGTG